MNIDSLVYVNCAICENQGADQQCGNRAADQLLCFRIIDISFPLYSKPKRLAIVRGCIAWFVSDLVGNSRRQIEIVSCLVVSLLRDRWLHLIIR